MDSFRCYDNSDVIATLVMTNFRLNTTVVAIFPNVCLWRRSLCSDLVLTLKNCVKPPPYARTAYVVAIWPSFLFVSFVKIWATCEMFLAPPGKTFPVRLCSEPFLWICGQKKVKGTLCSWDFSSAVSGFCQVFMRVSMWLTDRRKTAKNLVDSRKHWKVLTVSRK